MGFQARERRAAESGVLRAVPALDPEGAMIDARLARAVADLRAAGLPATLLATKLRPQPDARGAILPASYSVGDLAPPAPGRAALAEAPPEPPARAAPSTAPSDVSEPGPALATGPDAATNPEPPARAAPSAAPSDVPEPVPAPAAGPDAATNPEPPARAAPSAAPSDVPEPVPAPAAGPDAATNPEPPARAAPSAAPSDISEPGAAPAAGPEAATNPEIEGAAPAAAEADGEAPLAEGVGPPAIPVAPEANPTNVTVELSIGLRLGERYLGDVPVRITSDDVVSFPALDLLLPLREILDAELVEALEQAADTSGRLTIEAANAAGLQVGYDPGLLELAVTIPPDQRGEQVISLGGERKSVADLSQESPVAAFLTARADLDYVSESVDDEEGREPVQVDLASGIRLFGAQGVALLAGGDYQEDSDRPFARDHARLVYDRPDDAWRITAGDLDFEVADLQASQDVLGVSFEQTYDLQPRRSTRPIGRQQFVLEREATVDVVVNGITVRTLRLDPGRYDIRDFPFVAGSNDVQLIVEDAFGRREILDFSTSFANDLLEVGLAEFSYALGIASDVEDREREYDSGQPIASFFHRVGVLESLTLGANAQGSQDQQQTGVEAVWATPAGNFGANLAASRVDDVGWDTGFALDYEFPFQDDRSHRRLSVSADYEGRRFAALGDLDPDNEVVLDLDVDYSQDLAWDLRGSLSASYAIGRDDTADQRALALSLARAFGDLTLGVQAHYQDEAGGDRDLDFLLTGTYRLTQDQRIRVRHDTDGHTTRIDYDLVGASAVGGIGGTLSLEHEAEDDRVDLLGSVDYIGNRFEIGASHDMLMTDLDDPDAREQRSSLTLETALGFAGGKLALGRPIDEEGSFAIIYPHSSLAGNRVEVNPSQDGPDAVADLLGPALVDLQPYSDEQIEIEVEELPVGYDIGAGRYDLSPSLASGYALQVGSAASVSVLGTLLDPEGEPVALMGGQAIDLEDPEAQPVTVLSNSVGRFVAQPLRPGRYQIRMFTTPPLVATIEVGEDAIGLVDAGTLTLQRE